MSSLATLLTDYGLNELTERLQQKSVSLNVLRTLDVGNDFDDLSLSLGLETMEKIKFRSLVTRLQSDSNGAQSQLDSNEALSQSTNQEQQIKSDGKRASTNKRKVTLSVDLQGDNDPLRIKVKPTTKWHKVFNAFADYKGRKLEFLVFLYDGNGIQKDQTVGEVLDPEDIEQDDEDIQIQVMYHMEGGGISGYWKARLPGSADVTELFDQLFSKR